MTSLFNVVQFFDDGSSDYIRRNVGPEEAMTALGDYSRRPEHDSIVRVIECAMDRLELAMEGQL